VRGRRAAEELARRVAESPRARSNIDPEMLKGVRQATQSNRVFGSQESGNYNRFKDQVGE
jgi:hypothetical protein